MRKNLLEISLLIGLAVALVIGAAASETQHTLSEKLIRLHVIANSDTDTDQILKLHVRDRILSEITFLTDGVCDIESARAILAENLDRLTTAAEDEIRKRGFSYSVRTELRQTHFPTREYDSFSLPAGDYDALRVIIGSGNGKNWWCVLFPPLCVSAAEADVTTAARDAGLSDEEISLITSDEVTYRFKFKTIEIFEDLKELFS